MDKYTIAPPAGSTNNSVGAVDRKWKEGHFEKLPGINEYLAESTGYGIVSGCEPTISGLTVTVAAGVVHLPDGTRKEISATNITLDNADPSNPRIDLVYIDSTGTVAKITGTASASPVVPSVPSGGISVAQVSVAAGASTGTVADKRSMLPRYYNTGIVNVKDFGAVGDGVHDDTAAINEALSVGKVVIFPSGYKFGITSWLRVKSNTEIIIDGEICALPNSGEGVYAPCFALFDGVTPTPGYSGVHDVIIHGNGVFNANGDTLDNVATPFAVHHCSRVKIFDITIKNWYAYHAIEIGGSRDVTIRNLHFWGTRPNYNLGSTAEAIQIEHSAQGGTSAPPFDGTMSTNIIVDGCIFEPSLECPYMHVGVGIHSDINDPTYSQMFQNITIKNCTFRNFAYVNTETKKLGCIYFSGNVENVLIRDNWFTDNGGCGIVIGNYSGSILIDSNNFRNTYLASIKVLKINNLRITNNIIYGGALYNNENSTVLYPDVYFNGEINNLLVENNIVELSSQYDALPFHIPGTPYSTSKNFIFRNNIIENKSLLSTSDKTTMYTNLARFISGIGAFETLATGNYFSGTISTPNIRCFDFIVIKCVVSNVGGKYFVFDTNESLLYMEFDAIYTDSNVTERKYRISASIANDNTVSINANVKNIFESDGTRTNESYTENATGFMAITEIRGYAINRVV